MSLSLTATFQTKQNVVYPLIGGDDGATLRVAALTTDYAATLTALNNEGAVTWTLFSAPPFLSLEVNPTNPAIVDLKFTNPSADTHLFQCYVQADDGQSKVRYPLAIEVREPFGFTISGRTDNYQAYDFTAAPVVFSAVGLHGLAVADGSAQFIFPPELPAGFLFTTSDGNSAQLEVVQPTASSVTGGVPSTVPTSYEFKAYRPGSMYDSEERAYSRSVTIGTLSTKSGVVSQGVSCTWDETNGYVKLNVLSDYLKGTGSPLDYSWQIVTDGTATGNITDGGGSSQSFLEWTPSVAGSVTFVFTATDSVTKNISQISTIGPMNVGLPSTRWTGKAIKLLVDSPYKTGCIGQTVSFTVFLKSTDFTEGETVTVTPHVTSIAGAPELALPTPVELTPASPSAVISVVIPANSLLRDKWLIQLAATSSGARSGACQVVVCSNGAPSFMVNHGSTVCLAHSTGSSLVGTPLVSTNLDMTALTGVSYSLVGAPAGLLIQDGAIVGAADPGTYTFQIRGSRPGFQDAFVRATLTVDINNKPLSILNFTPETFSIQDNTQFHLYWGITGTAATLTLQKNMEVPRSVSNSISSPETITGTTIYSLLGSDYRGNVYSKPIVILSSSTAGLTQLPSSPATATIDEDNVLHLNWTPASLSDSYTYYKGWNIQIKKDDGPAQQLTDVNGALPTGLLEGGATSDSRLFVQQLQRGNYSINMQALSSSRNSILDADPWVTFKKFPDVLDTSTLVKDKATLKLKESLTIQLSNTYSGADFWRLTYSDGTTSGWLPIASKIQSKAFSQPGNQTVLAEFERVYPGSVDPVVKLLRSCSFSVFVQNEVYNSAEVQVIGSGNVGLGGEAGYEITTASSTTSSREPYEVIVKALVVDDQTQELKMLVATSRNNNASSFLNTMATDVFPLVGRPHLKDLIAPKNNVSGDMLLTSPAVITTTALPDAYIGQNMPEMQLLVSGGLAPYEWYSDSLPFGLKLSLDGTLSGTPLQIGVYNVNVSVRDSSSPAFIAETTLQMSVKSRVSIDTTSVPDVQVATHYTYQFTASGGLEPYSWSIEAGAPPLGLTLDQNTGILSGYPVTYNSASDFDTPFSMTLQVIDSVGARDSVDFSINLTPLPLTLGNIDQPFITKGSDFKLAIPVYGGRSPYSIAKFGSDGSIGNTLTILSPRAVNAISGQSSTGLTILTGDHTFSPSSYPYTAVIELSASGGVAPYTWSLNSTSGVTTLPSPVVTGQQLAGTLLSDGKTTASITVKDATGNSAAKLLSLFSTQNSGSGGGSVSLEYVTVNKNNSSNILNWTFTKISNLPDAKTAVTYRPDSSSFYGVALWNSASNRMYDLRLDSDQLQLKYLYSKLGGVGHGLASPYSLLARSLTWALPPVKTGTSASATNATLQTDSTFVASGSTTASSSVAPSQSSATSLISSLLAQTGGAGDVATWASAASSSIQQVLFSATSVVAPDGTAYPSSWQMINNDWIFITQANIGNPVAGTWTWAFGSNSTLPSNLQPSFVTTDGTTGATVVSTNGYVRLVPTTINAQSFQSLASALTQPYILEIVATDANGNSYTAQFNYYLVSGGQLRSNGTSAGSVLVWPDGTSVVYTSGFSVSSLGNSGGMYPGDYTLYTPTVTTSAAVTTLSTGSGTPYFPMPMDYYQGDYANRSSIQMAVGDNVAVPPVPGGEWVTGTNPYTFAVLNRRGFQFSSQGGYTLGTLVTDSNLSKEMVVTCTPAGGGVTPVVSVTSLSGASISLGATYDAVSHNWTFSGDPSQFRNWFYVLAATGGTAPYTWALEDGTLLPGLSIHSQQTSVSGGFFGDFLTIYNSPDAWSTVISQSQGGYNYVIKVSATDAQGYKSSVATIPVILNVTRTNQSASAPAVRVSGSNLTGGPFFINAYPVDLANQGLAFNITANCSLDGSLPEGLSFQNRDGGPLLHTSGTSIPSNSLRLVGTPTGTPTTITVNLLVQADGWTSLTVPITITTKSQSAKISLLTSSVQPFTHYSPAKGSPLVKVSLDGYSAGADHPVLQASMGVLSSPTIAGLSTYYSGVASYDLYYDFYSETTGGVNLTLSGAGGLNGLSSSFTVAPLPLQVTGIDSNYTVSEYQTVPFAINNAPLSIQGGVAPYRTVALSVGDTTHFYVQNGLVYLDMTKVSGGNTYQTDVTYSVTDSNQTTMLASSSSLVVVRVIAETFASVNFLNKTVTVSPATSTNLDVSSLISVQLGHSPFSYYVDAVTYSDPTMKSWVQSSPTGRRLVVNRTSQAISYTDYSDQSQITEQMGGGSSVTPTSQSVVTVAGASFSVPPCGTLTSGNYTVLLGLRVVDSQGLAAEGTSTVVLVVP